MLEIIFLIWFCKKLSAVARAKNRAGGWGALGAVFWVGGEIAGAVMGLSDSSEGMGWYGCALGGAVLGAMIAAVIVALLKRKPLDGELPVARML